ncbi:Hypothetical protein PYTT_2397 [Akkermansia glycaniphila]|uniref:Uncharacterized protein n=1 Tax=Akkermansia glycaniphila TaxID=1679444 RepID=A0A1C7P9L8_9BACT|nr:hypothetical protein AC781_11510 [Akkermansia glycaniphila]SEH99474.1 Hypothetical protein PYTT_2397 [Akkermansia glycaniphila]
MTKAFKAMSPAEKREYVLQAFGGAWVHIKALPLRFREDGSFYINCPDLLRYPWQVPCAGFVPDRAGIVPDEAEKGGGRGQKMRWVHV